MCCSCWLMCVLLVCLFSCGCWVLMNLGVRFMWLICVVRSWYWVWLRLYRLVCLLFVLFRFMLLVIWCCSCWISWKFLVVLWLRCCWLVVWCWVGIMVVLVNCCSSCSLMVWCCLVMCVCWVNVCWFCWCSCCFC